MIFNNQGFLLELGLPLNKSNKNQWLIHLMNN
jgi:hypothetical protein